MLCIFVNVFFIGCLQAVKRFFYWRIIYSYPQSLDRHAGSRGKIALDRCRQNSNKCSFVEASLE